MFMSLPVRTKPVVIKHADNKTSPSFKVFGLRYLSLGGQRSTVSQTYISNNVRHHKADTKGENNQRNTGKI